MLCYFYNVYSLLFYTQPYVSLICRRSAQKIRIVWHTIIRIDYPMSRACLLSLSLFVAIFPVSANFVDASQLYQSIKPSLCLVVGLDQHKKRLGLGSGFVLNREGQVVTNEHVIAQASSVVVECNGEKSAVTELQQSSAGVDLVVLSTTLKKPTPLSLSKQDLTQPGALVFILGNPHGLSASISAGIVAGVREFDGHSYVQLSGSINPGNSGGPVINQRGQVVAISTLKLMNAEAIGFALPVSYLKQLQQQKKGEVPLPGPNSDSPVATETVEQSLTFRGLSFGVQCSELKSKGLLFEHIRLEQDSNQLLSGLMQPLIGVDTNIFYRCKNGVFVEGMYGLMPSQLTSVLQALTKKYGSPKRQKTSMVSEEHRWQPVEGYQIKLTVTGNNYVLKYTHHQLIALMDTLQQMAAIEGGEL